MHTTSLLLLLRTQSTLRVIELTNESQREQLKPVFIGLGLIERILIGVTDARDSDFERIVLEIIDDALSTALNTIDEVI